MPDMPEVAASLPEVLEVPLSASLIVPVIPEVLLSAVRAPVGVALKGACPILSL